MFTINAFCYVSNVETVHKIALRFFENSYYRKYFLRCLISYKNYKIIVKFFENLASAFHQFSNHWSLTICKDIKHGTTATALW